MGAQDLEKQELFDAFREGAEAGGKDPETMPKIVETFVVVGGQEEAEYAANLWRFTVDPWSDELLYESDPREIQRKAEEMFSLEEVYQNWPMGEDAETHVEALQGFLDSGATRLFVHSGQQDQQRVIDFYGSEVLPQLRSS